MQPDALADVLLDTVDRALEPVETRLATLESRQQAAETLAAEFRQTLERLIVAFTPQPGPPGPPGPAGQDGRDGAPGQDGAPGLEYCGVFVQGRAYDRGQCVTWGGSMWHCNAMTTGKPGEGASSWTLMVKHGRDGKDASR